MRRNAPPPCALLLAALGCAACNGTIRVDDGSSGLSVGTGGGASGTGSSGGTSTGTSAGTSAGTSTGSSGGSAGDTGPIFDVGDTEPPPDGIPKTCSEAQVLESTVGCLFYGADLDNHPVTTTDTWGLAVTNVQEDPGVQATVRLQVKVGGTWMDMDEGTVSAGELLLFEPPRSGTAPAAWCRGAPCGCGPTRRSPPTNTTPSPPAAPPATAPCSNPRRTGTTSTS